MKTHNSFSIYVDEGMKNLRHLKNYREIAKRVKEIVAEEGLNAKIYVFGSVVEGRYTAASDIDILIVMENMDGEKAAELKAKIYGRIDAPIEIHAVDENGYKWYKRFIDACEEI